MLSRLAIGVVLVLGVARVSPAVASAAADDPHPPVAVSLTFDDGTSDQLQASTIMDQHGMKGTFYINSGRFGLPGYMSAADALALQADGNEIAGHTVSHADLPTLTSNEAARQICNDRVNLLNAGLRVTDFAYPFGDENASIEQIVQNCGYNSARGIGDIVSPGTCLGCAYAEHIPPVNPYALDTPDSIKNWNTLQDLETYVLQAEQHGGGWVILVMHHVCVGCDDPYDIAPSLLNSFLAWLALRASSGTTVQTVAQVVGGPLQPAVDGPTPPPPLSTTNLLKNPSMEDINPNNGVPTCWQRGGYGTNTFSWSNTTDAEDGNNAQRVDIMSYTDGDRRIMTPEDLGSCAPPTVVGHTYHVQGWYKTNGTVRLVAYSRNSLGGWTFLGQGPILPTSSSYVQANWTTPPMVSGSSALAIGFSLRSAGYLQADDALVNDTDQSPPTVNLTTPADGSRVRGTITLEADASDTSGVDHVDFLVDGAQVCTATTAPYTCTYDTSAEPDSIIAVTARAVDTAGNVGLSAGHNYTVSNSVPPDTTPPTVSIAAPTDGATVHGVVTLTADASDDDAVNEVLFDVNGTEVGAENTAPYQVSWDSGNVLDGTYTITATAVDRSGNGTQSAPIHLTVNNNALDTTPPSTTMTCNNAACGTTWYTNAVNVALTASDVGSGVNHIVYTTDGTDPSLTSGTTYTGPFSLTASTTVKYRAYDNAGNAEPISTAILNIDVVAPTATIASPNSGATVTGTTYIVASVNDNVSIARVWFYLDGKALGSRIVTPYQWKWNTATTTTGSHTLYIVAIDAAGNQTRSDSITVTVT